MIRNIWILIAKKLNGEATEEDLQELDALLAQPDTDISIEALQSLWEKTTPSQQNNIDELDEKWEEFDAQLNIIEANEANQQQDQLPDSQSARQGIIRSLLKYTAYAAVLALFAGVIYWKKIPARRDPGITSVAAPATGVSKIILPDGSKVWLNSGSKISYKNNNENQCREVTLSGEAYFDVVKDPSHPFTVETATFKIKVLGTIFNVRSYHNDNNAEATLVSGRIELTLLKDAEKKYILRPSERFKINNIIEVPKRKDVKIDSGNKYSSIELSKVEAHTIEGLPSETLWMKNVINFDGTDFEEIASMMEHKYNVNFVFKDEESKRLKFTGKFKNETIETAMKELQVTANFHYKITDNQITVF